MSYEAWGDGDDNAFEPAIEAGWLDPETLSKGLVDVMNERRRQQDAEGFTPAYDDPWDRGELAWAATAYLQNSAVAAKMQGLRVLTSEQADERGRSLPVPVIWPWEPKWWKPAGQRRDLVKAAALILAEIERLDRAEAAKP